MSFLVQAPDSKVWHIAMDERLKPLCKVDDRADSNLRWRMKGSSRYSTIPWRTPHRICTACSAEVESAVQLLIAAEESRDA